MMNLLPYIQHCLSEYLEWTYTYATEENRQSWGLLIVVYCHSFSIGMSELLERQRTFFGHGGFSD